MKCTVTEKVPEIQGKYSKLQDCCLRKFQGVHKAKSQEVRRPTCEVLGAAAAKQLSAKSIFLGTPGYQTPVRQQPCKLAQL